MQGDRLGEGPGLLPPSNLVADGQRCTLQHLHTAEVAHPVGQVGSGHPSALPLLPEELSRPELVLPIHDVVQVAFWKRGGESCEPDPGPTYTDKAQQNRKNQQKKGERARRVIN